MVTLVKLRHFLRMGTALQYILCEVIEPVEA